MRKTLIALVLALVALAGCNEEQRISTWVMSAQDTDVMGRVGVVNDNTEVGGVVKYAISSDVPWGPVPDFAGAYLIFHLTQDITVEDTPEPSPIRDFLEALHARPYAGVEIVARTDSHHREAQPNWIGGTKFTLSENDRIGLVVEYVDGDNASADVYVGARIEF